MKDGEEKGVMSKLTWTKEQEAAINFSETANLLLSAAAGSGKTTVLSERIITRAIAGDVDLSRVLVMTFTDLAAK
ncbi:MAG: UvrD-helicase domain-containing protein, partial [Saccharofermentanales bacterium]